MSIFPMHTVKKTYRQGASGALLDEYERALTEFIALITPIDTTELTAIADADSPDPNCYSVQTVLTHVVKAGYSYAKYIRRLKGRQEADAVLITRGSTAEYIADLKAMFAFTEDTFRTINETELEEHDQSKKMLVHWGQLYDIEQLMEHAIVHILRHRRQIERFRNSYDNQR
jgi:uncharacterized damage-inducible protein DinB